MCCIAAGGISLRPAVSCACAIRVGQNDGGHSAQPTQAPAAQAPTPAAPAPAAHVPGAAYLAAPTPAAQLPEEADRAGAQDQTHTEWAGHWPRAERAAASADAAASPRPAQLEADLQHPSARDIQDLRAPVLLNRTLARRIPVLPAPASRDLLHSRVHRNPVQAASSAVGPSSVRRRR